MAILFSEPLCKVYNASVFSCSYVFCWFLFLVAIVLPFFLAFSTYDFWKKLQIYQEQPQVLYREEIVVMIYSETESISGSSIFITPNTQVFSSLGSINDMYFESISPMLIESSLIDTNFDGLADSYDFKITAYTSSQAIRNIKIMSFYDYKIRSRIKMDMVGMALVDLYTPSGASTVTLDGYLDFSQAQPFKPSSVVTAAYNTSVLSLTSSYDNYLPNLLQRYNSRNYTTTYSYTSLVFPSLYNYTTISMKVRIPPYQQYEYAPAFLEVMKFAWIQYLSLLLPISYLIYKFAGFIYSNQILESNVSYQNKINK